MWRHGAGRTSKRKTWNGIAIEWNDLTIDWEDALARKPHEWPDSLGRVPQALAAYDEWRALPVPKAENLTEWVVREAVVHTIRPRIAQYAKRGAPSWRVKARGSAGSGGPAREADGVISAPVPIRSEAANAAADPTTMSSATAA